MNSLCDADPSRVRVAEPGVLLRHGVLKLLHSELLTPPPVHEELDKFTLFTPEQTSLKLIYEKVQSTGYAPSLIS